MKQIGGKWLSQAEVRHGEYGILLGGPRKPPLKPEETPHTAPEDRRGLQKFQTWTKSLRRLEMAPPELLDPGGCR